MTAQRFDSIVIGGGVIGCSVAYHLAKKGLKVMVLERQAVGSQSSRVAAGMLAAQEEASKPGPFFDLCVASRELFASLVPQLREKTGIDPEWERSGIWRLAETEKERASLMERMAWQKEKGHQVVWQEPQQLMAKLPHLQPCLGALYFPDDGHVHSEKWMHVLQEAGRLAGVRFVDHVPETSLIKEGNEITGVKTQTEFYFSDHVVVASGAWTPEVFASINLHMPIEPVKGQVMILRGEPHTFPGPVYAGSGYLVPKNDGRLIVGATVEHVGFSDAPTLAAQRVLADWAQRWCVDLQGFPIEGFQSGFRPGTPDGYPIMGPMPGHKGLFVCSGHYRNGVLLSSISGQWMADGIVDGHWDPVADTFSPSRFLDPTMQSSAPVSS